MGGVVYESGSRGWFPPAGACINYLPDSLYKSIGAVFKSKIHTNLTGGGYFFIYEWISTGEGIWANLIKVYVTYSLKYSYWLCPALLYMNKEEKKEKKEKKKDNQ